MVRMTWGELPKEAVAFVESVLGGKVVWAQSQPGGFSVSVASRVLTETGVSGFVKAVPRVVDPVTYDLVVLEAEVMTVLPSTLPAPRLRGWRDGIGQAHWIVLVFDDIEGLAPEGLGDVESVLHTIASLPPATGAAAELPDAGDELSPAFSLWRKVPANCAALAGWSVSDVAKIYELAESAVDVVRGDRIVHNDLRLDNILIDEAGKVWLVDWPHCVQGSPMFDGLLFVVDCLRNDPLFDIDQALMHDLFSSSPARNIDAVLAGYAAYCVYMAEQPSPPGAPTVREMQRDTAKMLLDLLQRRWNV